MHSQKFMSICLACSENEKKCRVLAANWISTHKCKPNSESPKCTCVSCMSNGSKPNFSPNDFAANSTISIPPPPPPPPLSASAPVLQQKLVQNQNINRGYIEELKEVLA